MRTARYVGGPLDGVTVTKATGPWHDYHNDEGRPVKSYTGYLEHHSNNPNPRFYRSARWRGEDLFIHGTRWDPWTGGPHG